MGAPPQTLSLIHISRAVNDIHPDLALLAQPERRAICCLCVESAGQKLSGLLEKKPFSRYVENGETTLLFDEAQSEAWRMEIERILRENGLCAGTVSYTHLRTPSFRPRQCTGGIRRPYGNSRNRRNAPPGRE